jgi:hypothetical protein
MQFPEGFQKFFLSSLRPSHPHQKRALQGTTLSYTFADMGQNNTDSVGFMETRTIRVVEQEEPLPLECGKTLGPIDVAYETCGQLNDSGDNAILICHALSGNAHVAGYNHPRSPAGGTA